MGALVTTGSTRAITMPLHWSGSATASPLYRSAMERGLGVRRRSAAGDGGTMDTSLSGFQGGVEVVEEANVLTTDVDIDEPAQRSLLVEQALLEPRMLALHIIEDPANRPRPRPSLRRRHPPAAAEE